MHALLRLTAIPHPDINDGESFPIYVEPTRILVIERGTHQFTKTRSAEQFRQNVQSLHEEVHRIIGELAKAPSMTPETATEAELVRHWVQIKDAAGALHAAYNLVAGAANSPQYHPLVHCTVVQLACGTGLEHGVMLARVYVTETPKEIVDKIHGGDWS